MSDYAMPAHVIKALKIARRWRFGASETPIRKDMAVLAAALRDAAQVAEKAARAAQRERARAQRAASLRKLAMVALWKAKNGRKKV